MRVLALSLFQPRAHKVFVLTCGVRRTARSLRIHMKMDTSSDHAVEGLKEFELAEFYHGLAIKIATQLSRVQVTS